MKLEHFGMAEPGDCRLVFTASAEELAAALAKEQAASDAPQNEEELLTAAVNRTILEGFDPLYRQLVREQQLVPVTDPDFELLAVNKAEGFRAGAQFYALPPLELGRDTGFVQAIEPHPLRRLTIELEINRSYGDEERAADAAGKAALRDRVTRELYAKRCAQARDRAEKELVWQLGDEVTGPVPKRLEAGNYFAEQRQFNLGLQANGINFDQFLAVRGQTVEQFRQWLHRQAERKLRSWLGLLLVAEREGLQPTEVEVNGRPCRLGREAGRRAHFPRERHPQGAPAPCPGKGHGLCGGAFHPYPAAGGAPCAGTGSKIKNDVIYAMAGSLRAARHGIFCKKGTAERPQVLGCPGYCSFIPDDASGRTFCLPSTSHPTAGLQAQGRPGSSGS